MIDGDEENYDW